MNLLACDLDFSERYRMAWQLTWPTIAVDCAWAMLVHGLLQVEGQGPMLVHEFFSLFVVAPFLVRRMVALPYPGFRIKTLFADGEGRMGYTESFKVMWLLSWRTTVAAMFLLLPVVAGFLKVTGLDVQSLAPSAGSETLNQIGLSLVLNSASFVLMPLIIPGMFAKRYQGFRVLPERAAATGAKRK